MKLKSFTLATLLVLINISSFAQTTVPAGEVSGTWESDYSPYLIDGDITIPDDSTLVIEPGVEVEFQGHFSLIVLGRLLAIGNETDSILFTVNDTTGFSDPDTSLGGWYGIRFIDTSPDNDSSKIAYCCLEYSKAVGPVWHLNMGGAICILQFGKVHISHSMIRHNSAGSTTGELPGGGGLYLFRSDIVLSDNTFLDNGAYLGGAVFMDDSDPVFTGNLIENNHAVEGAGIALAGECHPTFTNDQFLNNRAENHGGGMSVYQTSLAICENVTVAGNRALWGAGIGLQGGELQAGDCTFSGNRAETWGGGIAGDFATLELTKCTFSQDTSDWGSGGLHMDHAVADLNQCVFIENRAVIGGGFHALYSQVSCNGSNFLDNQADGGGAMHFEDSDCEIDQCQFQRNKALNGIGGAIDYQADSSIFERNLRFNLSRSSFTQNSSASQCGAANIQQLSTDSSLVDVVIDSCLFMNNHSNRLGSIRIVGYIENFVVSNSIFSNNTATLTAPGPALQQHVKGYMYNCILNSNYAYYSDTAFTVSCASMGTEAEVGFMNCTFIDTSSAYGYGLSLRTGAKSEITNTIFWGFNGKTISLFTGNGPGCNATVNYCNIVNGIDSTNVSDSLSILVWGEGNISEDPFFVDMPGGDLHLLAASPCIGAGTDSIFLNDRWITAPATDIEGNPRPGPQGSKPDMGAFEHERGTPFVEGIAPQKDPEKEKFCHVYPNPFRESTTFSYQLSEQCFVQLNIYNISGLLVARVVSESQAAGQHRVEWDGGGFASGPYFYRLLTSNGKVQSGKLYILK